MNVGLQKLFSIIMLLMFSFFIQGQEKTSRLYVGFKGGIKSGLGESSEETQRLILSRSDVEIALGSGYEKELFAGFKLNKNISIEIGYSFFTSKSNVVSLRDKYKMEINSYDASFKQLKPSIVFITDSKKINPYIKVGVNFTDNYRIINSQTRFSSANTIKSNLKATSLSEKSPIGYHTSIGIETKIYKRINVFCEFSVSMFKVNELSYTPSSMEFSLLGNPEFEDPYLSLGEPLYFPEKRTKASFSNYGFDIGIKYNLNLL